MDRLARIWEATSPITISSVALVCLCLLLVVPARLRLKLSLAAMVFISVLGKLLDFDTIANVAKAFQAISFILVAIAATMHPSRQRRLHDACWLFPILGFVGVFYVQNTLDFEIAVILRLQWFILALSAVAVARVVVDQRSLRYVLEGLAIGMLAGCMLTIIPIITSPFTAFTAVGRFCPYSANANQIGLFFAISVPVGVYLLLSSKSIEGKVFAAVLVTLASTQVLLTVSRAAIILAVVPSIPLMIHLLRQPVYAGLASLMVLFVGSWLIGQSHDLTLDHLDGGGIQSRVAHVREVLPTIEERLFTGLMFTTTEFANPDEFNSHNAYVELMYLGGLSLALPHFFLFGWAHWCAIRIWGRRKMTKYDPRAIAMLVTFSLCAFCHGFVNGMVLYPTYVWAFFNVLIASFLITESSPDRRSVNDKRLPSRRHASVLPPVHVRTSGAGALQAARRRRDEMPVNVRSDSSNPPETQEAPSWPHDSRRISA